MPHRPDRIEKRPVLAGLLIAGWLAAAPAAPAQTDAIGVVVRQSGIVTVLRAAVPGMLEPGDGVFRGDRVVTGPGARLRIAFNDGSTVAIGSRTDITVSGFVVSDDDTITEGILDLLRGIVRVALMPSTTRERFEIRTRTAVTSVRSTDWIVEATDTGASVFVVSGRVAVAAIDSGDSVTLERDFGTDVADGQPPSVPKRWGKKRVARILKLTD